MDYTIINREAGVYYFQHPKLFDVQIVLLNKVDIKQYPWMSLVQKRLSEDRADSIEDLVKKITDPIYREKASEVTDLVIERFMFNKQEEGAKKMGATRDLFKAEFEEKDNKIAELAKEVESIDKQLESKDKQLESKDKQLESKDKQLESKDKQLASKDSIIEKLKAELARLGGNVAVL